MMDKKLHDIKNLLGDPRWTTIQDFAKDLKNVWREDSSIGNNEFETLKKTFMKEGKVEGLNEFFRKLIEFIK